jgi:hypothetical protein
MKGMTGPILAGLAVLYALIILLSADQTQNGPALVKGRQGISDLVQTVMLQRSQQKFKEHPGIPDADRTMKVQQALKENGFYAGPVDGVMRQKTQEAIEWFQQSKHLKVTGMVDEETAQELGIR